MRDIATIEQPAGQPPAKPAQRDTRTLRIQGKLKAALDKMVWEGLEYAAAAKAVSFSTSSMRKAFSRPHVLAYLRAERQVLRESLSPRNIHRLREIRDAADNMPAIQAIRTLEGMSDDGLAGAAAVSASPGITIRILNVVQGGHANTRQPVTIDETPPGAIVSVVD